MASPGLSRLGKASAKRPSTRRLKAQGIMELQVKGVPCDDIARAYGVHPRTVTHLAKWGEDNGIVEEVRDRLQKQLDRVPNIYAEILAMDPSDTNATALSLKIQQLRLKAAGELAKGMGSFRKPDEKRITTTASVDLDEFYKLRAARAAGQLPPSDTPEVAALLEERVTDVDSVEEERESDEQE